jgi:hypothetical protein
MSQNINNTRKTIGEVINLEYSTGDSVVITIRYVVEGVKYFLLQTISTSDYEIESIDVGNTFEVVYNENDPDKAKVENFTI